MTTVIQRQNRSNYTVHTDENGGNYRDLFNAFNFRVEQVIHNDQITSVVRWDDKFTKYAGNDINTDKYNFLFRDILDAYARG